jgi:hypothetical protein
MDDATLRKKRTNMRFEPKSNAKYVAFGTGILFFVVSTSYIFYQHIREEIIFVLSAFAGWGAVYSAFYVAETLRVQIAQKNLDLQQDRINRSFELKESFDDPLLIRFRTEIENMIKKMDSEMTYENKESRAKMLYEKIANDPEMLTAARSNLNKMESVSLAIQFGNADERVLYRDLAMMITNTYRNLEFFVRLRRERIDITNAHRAFRETQKLVESWEEGRMLSTGEKISF